jgi:hypothetical protein
MRKNKGSLRGRDKGTKEKENYNNKVFFLVSEITSVFIHL